MKQSEFAGDLRERIRVERVLPARDTLGAAAVEQELIGEFWAAAEAVGTGDEGQAESRASMQRWRFILRPTDAILPGDIVDWSGRMMTISAMSVEHRPEPKTILLVEEKR